MSDRETFAATLRAIRAWRRIEQKEIAEKMGIVGMTVSRWESGHTAPDVDEIVKLARCLSVDPRIFFSPEMSILMKPYEIQAPVEADEKARPAGSAA